MMQEPRPATEERLRECGCQEYVVACAHWQGSILLLSDSSKVTPHAGHTINSGKLRLVRLTEPTESNCSVCGAYLLRWEAGDEWIADFNDPGAALAAFYEQEASLIRGEG